MAYQTPYFVIDENQLMKDFQMLKSSLEREPPVRRKPEKM